MLIKFFWGKKYFADQHFLFLARNAWSRAEEPIEIGDLTREESLDYLINKREIKTVREGKIDTTEAERLYELVGGRIVDLQSVTGKFLKGQDFEGMFCLTLYIE